LRLLREGSSGRLSNLVVLFVAGLGLLGYAKQVYVDNVFTIVRYPNSQIMELSRWAKENTADAEMFLIDPNWSEFRALSQRPVFVTWKDGTAMLWKRDFINEWVPRIEAFGFDFYKTDEVGTPDGLNHLSRLYKNLNDQQVLKLTQKYPIRYWVVQHDQPSQFPVVYQTPGYKVLKIIPEINNGS
jgi:hypothetical protein